MDSAPQLGPQDWSVRFETAHNFLAVKVTPDRLTVRALAATSPGSETFAEIDSVEIPRDCSWPAVDLSAVPATRINMDIMPGPLRPILLWGGTALLVVALALKLAKRLRRKASQRAQE
jgi:hypothetical protein